MRIYFLITYLRHNSYFYFYQYFILSVFLAAQSNTRGTCETFGILQNVIIVMRPIRHTVKVDRVIRILSLKKIV